MNNTFYFLRHGETEKDLNVLISQWKLSEKGEEQARKLADENTFSEVDIVIASTEEKAYQTAKPIADKLKREIIRIEEISELNRDKGGFMGAENYEKTLKYCLENLDKSLHNWETAEHALERFSKKIEQIDKEYENKKILVVGHGFIINLYFAKLLNALSIVHERFNTNEYADWGVIKNGQVIKDIATAPSALLDQVVETERLLLVPVSDKYAQNMFTELTDEITEYMFFYSPKAIEEEYEFIKNSREKMEQGIDFAVTILDRTSKEFLGGAGIHRINTSTPELGIWTKKSAHGKKIGRESVAGLKKWADENINYEYLIYPADKNNIPSRKIAESLGGKVASEGIKESPYGKKLDEVVYHIPNQRMITNKQIYQMLSEVCDLLNKNNIQYLVYGSAAINLLAGEEKYINDIDIIVKETDFEKIKNVLPNSFDPIQTKFNIHANSKEYSGKDGKSFDISFDSYLHYFNEEGVNFNNYVEKEIAGVAVKVIVEETLKRIYKKYPKGSAEFYDPRLVAIYNTVCPIDEYKDFYLDLAEKLDASKTIDIGCGSGLLTIELSNQGYKMIGVEPSSLMLDLAKQNLESKKVEWIEGDALSLEDINADLAIMTGHVAQFHIDNEYWLRVLKAIYKSLKPGGYFAFESRNPNAQPWVNNKIKVDWFSPDFSKKVYDPIEGEIEIRVANTEVKGSKVVNELEYTFVRTGDKITSKTQLIFRTKEELSKSLEDAGFKVDKYYGNWDWTPAGPDSPELIFIAKK